MAVPCPPGELLQRLLADGLSALEEERLDAHLRACTTCRQRLDVLSGGRPDPAPPPPPTSDEPALARLLKAPPADPSPPTPPPFRLLDPTAVGGPLPFVPGYDVLTEIGRGGLGVVYKAVHQQLRRVVALKMIRKGTPLRPADRERFRLEAEAASRVRHPHVVPVYEVGEHEGNTYFTMEFVDGGALGQRLGGAPMPPREAARLVEMVARAAHALHHGGIIHRDLTPANILLAPADAATGLLFGAGRSKDYFLPKISDFGLAKDLRQNVALTHSRDILGTPAYMAPEQAQGRRDLIGPATDVYALGAILYELLTGRPPFRAASTAETLLQVAFGEPLAPNRLTPGLSRDLEAVCLKCLEKEPRRRYASAEALADDLRRFLDGVSTAARPWGRLARAGRWAKRNRLTAALLLALVVVLVGGTVVSWLFAADARRHAADAEHYAAEARAHADRYADRAYAADMALVARAWDENNIALVRNLLDAQTREADVGVDRRGFEWDYWNRLSRRARLVLRGPNAQPVAVAFHPDGRHLVGGFADGTVLLWDTADGHERRRFRLEKRCAGLAISPDGRTLAVASDRDVVFHDADGRETGRLGHDGPVHALTYSPDGRLLARAVGRSVQVRDLATGVERPPMAAPAFAVQNLAFLADGRLVGHSSHDATARLWDAAGGEVKKLQETTAVGVSADRRAVALGGWRNVGLWTPEAGPSVRVWEGGKQPVATVACHPDGGQLALAMYELGVLMVNARGGRVVATLRDSPTVVRFLAFAPDGTLAAAEADGTVRLYPPDLDPDVLVVSTPHTILDGALTPEGHLLAASPNAAGIRLWDAATGAAVHRDGLPTGKHTAVAVAADGRVACGSADGTVRVGRLGSRAAPLTFRPHEQAVNGLTFDPTGALLATASADGTAAVWDAATGANRATLRGHTDRVVRVAFGTDGRHVATASHDGTARVWDTATGAAPRTLTADAGRVLDVAFSPDGITLATAHQDATTRLWNFSDGTPRTVLSGDRVTVGTVGFSPDGTRLASGAWDGRVVVRDARTGAELLQFRMPINVMRVAFSPDGRRLAAFSLSGIQVWHAPPRPVVE